MEVEVTKVTVSLALGMPKREETSRSVTSRLRPSRAKDITLQAWKSSKPRSLKSTRKSTTTREELLLLQIEDRSKRCLT
jgi:hypothetical protein